MYSYGPSARHAQWNKIHYYSVPPASLENNQPWLQLATTTGMPFWRHIVSGEVTSSMPDAFKRAMLSGGASSSRGFGDGEPGHEGASDKAPEQTLLEYTLQLSLNDTHKPIPTAKANDRTRKDRRMKNLMVEQPMYKDTIHVHPTLIHNHVYEPSHGKCTACFTDTSVSQAPCDCKYCPDCLAGIFMQALEYDKFIQPSCCGRLIPMELVAPIMEQTGFGVQNLAGKGKDKKGKGKERVVMGIGGTPKEKANVKQKEKVDCLICMETFNKREVIITPCQHFYCKGCMKRLFVEATRNESLYPPRCCGKDIPMAVANVVLNSAQQTEFNTKGNEWRTKDRLYCSSKTCSAFIIPAYIKADIGTCNRCQERTCVHCKGPYHRGDCPKDKAIQEVLKFAQKSGWRKCYSCKMLVELNAGCNHITCLCGAQFCYVCGAKWPTCNCKLWKQENLNNVILEEMRQENLRQYRRAEFGDHYRAPPPGWHEYRGYW